MPTRISVDLSEDLYRKLKIHCAMEGLTIADVVRKLLEKHFVKAEKKLKK
jgi:predicted DNA binding CopG/RHH family protein